MIFYDFLKKFFKCFFIVKKYLKNILLSFSVVENVKKANEKELNLLHRLLYGRDESVSFFFVYI